MPQDTRHDPNAAEPREYPKEQQNPPQEPGLRPADQVDPKQRVPRDWQEGQPDPRQPLDENPHGTDRPNRDATRERPEGLDKGELTPASEDRLR